MKGRASLARTIVALMLCMTMVAGAPAILPGKTEAGTESPTTSWVCGVVTATAPTANAGPDQSVYVGDQVTFDGSGSTDNIQVENYTWTFAYDGHNQTLTGVNPKFTFAIAGTYTVTLTVKDPTGDSNTDTTVIAVTEPSKSATPTTMVYIGAAAAAVAIVIAALFLAMRKKGGSSLVEEEDKESEEEVEYDLGPPEDGKL